MSFVITLCCLLLAAGVKAQTVTSNQGSLEKAAIPRPSAAYDHHPVPWSGTYEQDYAKGFEFLQRLTDKPADSKQPAAGIAEEISGLQTQSSPAQPSTSEASSIGIEQNLYGLLEPSWLMLLAGLASCIGIGVIASRIIGSRVNKNTAQQANFERDAVNLETKIAIVRDQYANRAEMKVGSMHKTPTLKSAPSCSDRSAQIQPPHPPQPVPEVAHTARRPRQTSAEQTPEPAAKHVPFGSGVKKREDLHFSSPTTADTKQSSDAKQNIAPPTEASTELSSTKYKLKKKQTKKIMPVASTNPDSSASTKPQRHEQPQVSVAHKANAGKAASHDPVAQNQPLPKAALAQPSTEKAKPAGNLAKEDPDKDGPASSAQIIQLIQDFEDLVNTTEGALRQNAFGEKSRENIVKAIEKATKLIKNAYLSYSADAGSEQHFTKAIKKATRVITKALTENMEEESARLKLKVNE